MATRRALSRGVQIFAGGCLGLHQYDTWIGDRVFNRNFRAVWAGEEKGVGEKAMFFLSFLLHGNGRKIAWDTLETYQLGGEKREDWSQFENMRFLC
eukprot:1315711-Amorphochlora_amoeboformis.AAC.1